MMMKILMTNQMKIMKTMMNKQEEPSTNIFEELSKSVNDFMETLDDLLEQINKSKITK